MSCCDNANWEGVPVGECPACGADIDKDGDATEICCYSPVDCDVCGSASCDGSC